MVAPRQLPAVATLFLANGLALGVYGGSLPGLRTALDLGAGHIVGILVAAGACAVVSMNLSGPFSDRYGARLPSFLGGGVMGAGLLQMGGAPTYLWLLVGAALFGLGNGAMDVAMNALGVAVEQARHRPVMSRLHAFFSLGNFTGALLVVALGRLQGERPSPVAALWVAAGLLVVLLLGVAPRVVNAIAHSAGSAPDQVPPGADGLRARAGLRSVVALLAVMALCFGLTEGTAIDWSSLHVAEVGGVGPSAAAWGLACVSGFMVVIRLLGDAVVERLGRALVVRVGACCALGGYLLTALAGTLPVILAGWCLVGLGVGLLAPQIYGLAGHIAGGRGLAVVVSTGYAAFLIGPAIIGLVAAHVGLQLAMLVPVVSALGLVVMSARMPRVGSA